MKTVAIAELKARLSAFLKEVKAGNEIVITERGNPVARLVPLEKGSSGDERLARLVRAGLVRPGRGKVRASLTKPPAGGKVSGVLEALLEERGEGR